MKKHYDKILLIVAVAVLAASFLYFKTLKGGIESEQRSSALALQNQPGGENWNAVNTPPLNLETMEWPEVAAQDEEGWWLYQLFTSPKIWIDGSGQFVAEPPERMKDQLKRFGYRFGEVKNEAYPIIYRGYFIGPEGDAIVQLYDEANNTSMMGKLNEEIRVREKSTGRLMDSGITVKSFDRKSVKDPDTNIISQVVTIVVNDKNMNRDITIDSRSPTYIEERRIMVLTPDNTSLNRPWEIKAVGDTMESGGSTYTVKELNFEEELAVIEMFTPDAPANTQRQLMRVTKDNVEPVK